LGKFNNLYHPENYHGYKRTKRYFEGWYYKVLTKDEKHAFAFIPGIAMDENGNKQAFIQVLDGINKTADYVKFEALDFIAKPDVFDLNIKNNHFTKSEITLDLEQVKGKLSFKNQVPWSSSLLSPGIMGPFSFFPRMECYHGILSMNHDIEGGITYKGEEIDFTGGRGYMEKDWGRSFPSA
jgi:tocopherol cyclase